MSKDEKTPRVEGSTENIQPENERKIEGIEGLEDVPRSIIPVPYYTLVQPESTKVTLPNGERAQNGSFLLNDIRETVNKIDFVVLRAKRQTRTLDGDKIVSLNVLGLNLKRQKPFILNVPITSFSAFGRFFEYLQDKGASKAWEYGVTATTEEVSGKKQTSDGLKEVSWYIVRLSPTNDPVGVKLQTQCQQLYYDFASKLDRNDEDDLAEIAGKVFSEDENNKNG